MLSDGIQGNWRSLRRRSPRELAAVEERTFRRNPRELAAVEERTFRRNPRDLAAVEERTFRRNPRDLATVEKRLSDGIQGPLKRDFQTEFHSGIIVVNQSPENKMCSFSNKSAVRYHPMFLVEERMYSRERIATSV